MEHVYAPNNFITSAKFENSPNFKEIYLNYNELTTLSFTDNPKLNTLFCGDNKLTSLELKDIEKITYLNFYNNLLTSINLKTVMLQNGGFFDYRENPNFRYICCDIASFESIRNRVEEFIEVNTYCSKDTNQNINKITGVVRYDIDKIIVMPMIQQFPIICFMQKMQHSRILPVLFYYSTKWSLRN